MSDLSKAEAALLGLLSEMPMYPYQIEQEVQFRDMRFWSELSMSSIYKLLKKLEEKGFVTRENKISEENRVRKLYTLSGTGKKELKAKIMELLSEPEHIRWQLDIGTYNINLLSKKDSLKALGKYREELDKKIVFYEDLKKCLGELECPEYRFAVATRPIFLLKGEIQWVDSYREMIEKGMEA